MATSIDGIVSGFDTKGIIDALLAAERKPIENLQTKRSDLTFKQDTFKEVNDELYKLQQFALALRLESTFKSKLITSSDEKVVRATGTTEAVRGTHIIKVDQIAEAAKAESQVVRTYEQSGVPSTAGLAQATGSAVSTTEGTHSLTFTSGRSGRIIGRTSDLTGDMTLGDLGVTSFSGLKFSIDGITGRLTDFNADTTLDEFIGLVNTQVPLVRAELLGGRVVLTGSVGGRDFTMTDIDYTNGVARKVFGFSGATISAAEIVGARTGLTAGTTLSEAGVTTFNNLGVIIEGTRYTPSSSGPYNGATTIATVLADLNTDVPGITASLTDDGHIAVRADSSSVAFTIADANYADDMAAGLLGLSGRQFTQGVATSGGLILTAASSGAHILSGVDGLTTSTSLQSLGVATTTGFTIALDDGRAYTLSGLSTYSSIQDLIDTVNSTQTGVVAQLVGGRIQLTSTDGGRNFTITDANYADGIARMLFGATAAQSTADSPKGAAGAPIVVAASAGKRGMVVGTVGGLTSATTLAGLGIGAGNENSLRIRVNNQVYSVLGLAGASTIANLISAIESSGAPVNAYLDEGRLVVEAEGNDDALTLYSGGSYIDGVLRKVLGYEDHTSSVATITSAVTGLTRATALDGAIGRGITSTSGFTFTFPDGSAKTLTLSGSPPTVGQFIDAVNAQVSGVSAILTTNGAVQLRADVVGMNFRVSDTDYVGTIAGELFQLTRSQSTLTPASGNAVVTSAPTGSQVVGLELALFAADFADGDKTAGGEITFSDAAKYSVDSQKLYHANAAANPVTDRAILGDATWSDYAVEFEGTLATTVTNTLSVELRYDSGTGNTYRADVTNAGININYDIGAGDVLVGTIAVPAGFNVVGRHNCRFEVEGTSVRAFVDGSLLGVVTDTTSGGVITAGQTTFRTDDDGEKVYWDNVRVVPLMTAAGDDALLASGLGTFGVQSPSSFAANLRNVVTEAGTVSTIQELMNFFNGNAGLFADFADVDITEGGLISYEFTGADPWTQHAASERLQHQPGVSNPGTDRARFGESTLTDYSIEFNGEVDTGTSLEAELRYDPTAGTHYRVQVTDAGVNVYYNVGGGDVLLQILAVPAGFTGIANNHRYEFSVENRTMTVSIDGTHLGTVLDSASGGVILSGGATFRVDSADDTYFDDLRVVPRGDVDGLSAEIIDGRIRVTADDPRYDFGIGDTSQVIDGTISETLFGLRTSQFTYAAPQGAPLVTAASTDEFTVADTVIPLHGGSPEFHTTTGVEGVAVNYLYEGGTLYGTGYNQSFVNGEEHLYTSAELAAGVDTVTKVDGGVDVGQAQGVDFDSLFREAKAGTYYAIYNYTGAPTPWHYIIVNADGVQQGEGVRGSATDPDQFVSYADSDLAGSTLTYFYTGSGTPTINQTFQFVVKLDTSASLASAGFATPASTATNGVFTINGKAIRIDDYATQTVDEILAKINSSGAGVIARYDDEDDRFILVSTTLGSQGKVQLGSAGDTSNFLRIAKLTTVSGAKTTAGVDNKEIDLSVAVGGSGTNLSTVVTSGTFTINGVRLYIDAAQDSLQDILDRINDSGALVAASYDSATDRLILRNDIDDPANLTNTNRIRIGSASDTSNFFEAVKYSVASQLTTQRYVGDAGKDAKVVVDGTTYLRAKNVVDDVLQGVTLTLMSASDSPVSINVDVDTDRGVKALADFVAEYNAIVDSLNPPVLTTSERKYLTPLTDDERAKMTFAEIEDYDSLHDQYKKQELIRTDGAYRRIMSSLRRAVLDPVSGLPTSANEIRDLGIDTYTSLNETVTKGTLVYDSTDPEEILAKLSDIPTLLDALREMEDDVLDLFASQAYSGSGSQAISTQKVSATSGIAIPDGGALTFRVGDSVDDSSTITLQPNTTYSQADILQLLDRAGLDVGDTDEFLDAVNIGASFDSEGRMVFTALNGNLSTYQVMLDDTSRTQNSLANLFGFDLPRTGQGISRLFNDILGSALRSDGVLGDRVRLRGSIDQEIQRVDDSITEYERRVSQREAALQKKYTNMEKMLSQLQEQASYLAQQIAVMQATTQSSTSSNG